MTEPTDTPGSSGGRVLRLRKKDRALSDAHRAHLRGSGLTDESIDAGGFFSERAGRELADILGWRGWPKTRGDGLVIPFFKPEDGAGAEPFFARVRPDQPRVEERTGKVTKYEQPKDVGIAPYFPVRSRIHRRYLDMKIPLAFTEGEKKAALLDQLGYAAIGATGVSCFHDTAHRADTDEYRLHEMIRKHVAIEGRECFIVFDSDQAENDNVIRAARVLAGMLVAAGAASVRNVVPLAPDGGKRGIDDFFVEKGEADTRALFAAAEPIEGMTGNEHADTVVSHRVLEGIPLDPKLRMPHGYTLQRDGSLWHDDGKKTSAVERSAVFIRRLVADLYTGHELVELVFRRDKRWRTAVMPRRVMADSRMLVAELAPIGAPVDSNSASAVVKWLRDFESINERRLPRTRSVSRCGWHTVDDETVFVMGGEVMRAEGSALELVVDRAAEKGRLSRGLTARGNQEEHLEALRKAWSADRIAAAAICSALAAPLLRVLGVPNFGLHLAGDSSRGKSSMLKIAASIYGDPRDEEWVSSWNSTTVGHEQRAAHLSDLPLCIDEAGVVESKERDRAVYMLMNGVGRTRGARDGGLRDTASWRTVVISTGERLLAEEASATGAQVRVLQLQVAGFGSLDAAGVDDIRRGCEANYGAVGRAWLEQWIGMDEAAAEAHREGLQRYVRAFQALTVDNLRARQATWWALLAYVEATAHQALGLGDPNGSTIHQLFVDPSDAHVTVRSASDRALDLVRHWIAAEPTAFPVLVHTTTGGKAPKVSGHPREIHGYIDDDGSLLLLPHALRSYLAKANIDDGVVLREWRAKGYMRRQAAESDRLSIQLRVGGTKIRVVVITAQAAGIEAVPAAGPGSDDWGGDEVRS